MNKKVKNTVHGHTSLLISAVKKLLEHPMKKRCRGRQIEKSLGLTN